MAKKLDWRELKKPTHYFLDEKGEWQEERRQETDVEKFLKTDWYKKKGE